MALLKSSQRIIPMSDLGIKFVGSCVQHGRVLYGNALFDDALANSLQLRFTVWVGQIKETLRKTRAGVWKSWRPVEWITKIPTNCFLRSQVHPVCVEVMEESSVNVVGVMGYFNHPATKIVQCLHKLVFQQWSKHKWDSLLVRLWPFGLKHHPKMLTSEMFTIFKFSPYSDLS